MNLVERFRGYVVDAALTRPTFSPLWPSRRNYLQQKVGVPASHRALVEMGNHLSDAQRLAPKGRRQSQVTAAGTAWHCLVSFYLNVVYAGTEAVAVTRGTAPRSIKDAMKVSYGGTSVEGDLDVALIVLPDSARQADTTGTSDDAKRKAAKRKYWELFDQGFRGAYVCLIACKTNWNDAIQAIMLWNLLYSIRAQGGDLPSGISIGAGGFSLDDLAGFTNAFVTVPTNKLGSFKPTGMPVQRARGMTGGHYWGYPTRPGICPNIQEFLDRQASASRLVPRPATCGLGFLQELQSPTGAIDLAAFDFAWPTPKRRAK